MFGAVVALDGSCASVGNRVGADDGAAMYTMDADDPLKF